MAYLFYKYSKPTGRSVGLIRRYKAPGTGCFAKCNTLHIGPSNDPNRAKGMQPFTVHGVTVYAGTLKGAHKLFRRYK